MEVTALTSRSVHAEIDERSHRSVGGSFALNDCKLPADLAVYRSIYVINGSRLITAMLCALTFVNNFII